MVFPPTPLSYKKSRGKETKGLDIGGEEGR